MVDDDDDASSLITKLVICLIAAASVAMVVTVYHCITTNHILTIIRRSGSREIPPQQPRRRTTSTVYEQDQSQQQNSSIENSLAELIPSHKYQKGGGGAGVGGLIAERDGMCAVCLSDFEEGEMIRTLPECMHSYHAPCIDMWLYSHSNCPMCRTNAAPSLSPSPSPQMLMHLLESTNNSETPPSGPRVSLFPLQQQQIPAGHSAQLTYF